MKKTKVLLVVLLLVSMTASLFTGCAKKYESLDTEISGSIDIMTWSGSGVYMEDLGHQEFTVAELTGQFEAAIYAMAKEFNKTYPNVKINTYCKVGGPDDGIAWTQEIENFKAEHGKYPDIYASMDLVSDVTRGLVADLSVFADDPTYKSFNPSIMKMMNYYGFQAGLPLFIQPWGVYVNKELAEVNNIDIPPIDWNFDEYTAFATSGDNKTFWGAMDVPMSFIASGTKDITYMQANYTGEGDHVNINSDAVNELLSYIPKWSKSAIYTQNDAGNIPAEIMAANGNSYNFFKNGLLLTDDFDPWMMGDAANPTEGHWGTVQSNDWDIYPRPSTEYAENSIGVVLDPMAIHNYAMDDGNPEWSDAEKQALKVAYTFGTFWTGSTASIKARAAQYYMSNGVEKACLNDSLPLVTGKEFDEQIEIWYSTPTHQRFADETKMPGWQKVMEIWKGGKFWDVSSKSYPNTIMEDGVKIAADYEWNQYWNKDISGALRTDSNWLDQIKAKLPDWNTKINERFVIADQQLRDGLTEFYGFTAEKFEAKKK